MLANQYEDFNILFQDALGLAKTACDALTQIDTLFPYITTLKCVVIKALTVKAVAYHSLKDSPLAQRLAAETASEAVLVTDSLADEEYSFLDTCTSVSMLVSLPNSPS